MCVSRRPSEETEMLAGEFYYTEMITQKLRASFFSLRRRRERESTAAVLYLNAATAAAEQRTRRGRLSG